MEKVGEANGIRTRGLRRHKPLLYQLSYNLRLFKNAKQSWAIFYLNQNNKRFFFVLAVPNVWSGEFCTKNRDLKRTV